MANAKTPGARVKQARKLNGISQKRLNAVAELAEGHLSRIEGGKRVRLRQATCDALAEGLAKLGVVASSSWLRTGVGAPPRKVA